MTKQTDPTWLKDPEVLDALGIEAAIEPDEDEDDDDMTYRILKFGVENEVAGDILEALTDKGYSAAELIPGLILAAVSLAAKTTDESRCLDEMSDLLDEGFADTTDDAPVFVEALLDEEPS